MILCIPTLNFGQIRNQYNPQRVKLKKIKAMEPCKTTIVKVLFALHGAAAELLLRQGSSKSVELQAAAELNVIDPNVSVDRNITLSSNASVDLLFNHEELEEEIIYQPANIVQKGFRNSNVLKPLFVIKPVTVMDCVEGRVSISPPLRSSYFDQHMANEYYESSSSDDDVPLGCFGNMIRKNVIKKEKKQEETSNVKDDKDDQGEWTWNVIKKKKKTNIITLQRISVHVKTTSISKKKKPFLSMKKEKKISIKKTSTTPVVVKKSKKTIAIEKEDLEAKKATFMKKLEEEEKEEERVLEERHIRKRKLEEEAVEKQVKRKRLEMGLDEELQEKKELLVEKKRKMQEQKSVESEEKTSSTSVVETVQDKKENTISSLSLSLREELPSLAAIQERKDLEKKKILTPREASQALMQTNASSYSIPKRKRETKRKHSEDGQVEYSNGNGYSIPKRKQSNGHVHSENDKTSSKHRQSERTVSIGKEKRSIEPMRPARKLDAFDLAANIARSFYTACAFTEKEDEPFGKDDDENPIAILSAEFIAAGKLPSPSWMGISSYTLPPPCITIPFKTLYKTPLDRSWFQMAFYGKTALPLLDRGEVQVHVKGLIYRRDRAKSGFRFNKGQDLKGFADIVARSFQLDGIVPHVLVPARSWMIFQQHRPSYMFLSYPNAEIARAAITRFDGTFWYGLKSIRDNECKITVSYKSSGRQERASSWEMH